MNSESTSADKTYSLLRNSSFVVASELLKPVLSFFFIVFLARRLGVDGVGDYSVILTYLSLFEVLASLGLATLIVRGVAASPKEVGKYLRAVIQIGGASSIFCSALLLLLLGYLGYTETITFGIQILCVSLVFAVFTHLMQALLEGMQRMGIRSCLVVGEVVLRVTLGVLAVWLGYGVLGVVWAIVLTRLIIFCASLFILVGKLKVAPESKLETGFLYGLLRRGFTFLLIIFSSIAYWSMDVLMLAAMKGSSDVGIYSSAYRIMDVVKNLSFGYTVALFPVVTLLYVSSKSSFENTCTTSIKYLFIFTFPAVVGVSVLSERIIILIYGSEFIDASQTLRILIWTACFFPVMLVFSKILMASHNEKADLWANILGLCLNVLLNLLLIPSFGYNGAAIATVISIIFFLVFQYLAVSLLVFKAELLSHLVRPFIAAVLMSGIVYICKDAHLIVALLFPALAYFGFLYLLRTFTPDEILIMRHVWGRVVGRLRATKDAGTESDRET